VVDGWPVGSAVYDLPDQPIIRTCCMALEKSSIFFLRCNSTVWIAKNNLPSFLVEEKFSIKKQKINIQIPASCCEYASNSVYINYHSNF
jgi:hypothetical protein